MAYQLMFCLVSEDNGTRSNPRLSPILDANGSARLFFGLEDAHRALNRLRRIGDDLMYYVTPVPTTTEQPGAHNRSAPLP